MSQEISATACQVLVHNASVRRILVRCHVMLVSIVKHDLFVFVDSNLIYRAKLILHLLYLVFHVVHGVWIARQHWWQWCCQIYQRFWQYHEGFLDSVHSFDVALWFSDASRCMTHALWRPKLVSHISGQSGESGDWVQAGNRTGVVLRTSSTISVNDNIESSSWIWYCSALIPLNCEVYSNNMKGLLCICEQYQFQALQVDSRHQTRPSGNISNALLLLHRRCGPSID